jgi:WD40 repeat protein
MILLLFFKMSFASRSYCLYCRAVAIAPNSKWFATTSISGRCAVTYFERMLVAHYSKLNITHTHENVYKHLAQARPGYNFSFKCHREANTIFPVNGVAFHPDGGFATCGNDNAVMFWDEGSRQRLANKPLPVQLLSGPPGLGGLVDCQFSRSGARIAVAAAYDWSRGPEAYYPESAVFVATVPSYAVRLRPRTTRR